MRSHLNYSGFVIALVGFVLTRFTVTLAISEDPMRFYLAGVLPLALGLGLAAFGVALAVADLEASFVRTTALWCVVGAATMLLLALLTILGTETAGTGLSVRSQTYLSNYLIGGSVGGTLTGLYAASNRRKQIELRRQADRLAVLNTMLRHKILNALTSLRGYAMADRTDTPEADAVIEERSSAIEETVDEVRYFTNRTGAALAPSVPTDLADNVASAVATIEDRYPAADVSVAAVPEDLSVLADDRLARVFVYLLEYAIVHGDDETPRVAVSTTADRVHVTVADDGPGMPAAHQQLLETGDLGETDNLDVGFGLYLARLFAESYGAGVETTVENGTEITLTFDRPEPDSAGPRSVTGAGARSRPTAPDLVVTVLASLVAGVFYAVGSEAFGGSVAGIGVFYGIADPIVGWLTHQFHSVVFGFMYVSLVTLVPGAYRDTLRAYFGVGLAWAMALWLGAAGVIAPIWLRLIGIPASLPNVTLQFFVAHLFWGVSLAACVAVGFRYVAPRLRAGASRRGGSDGAA